MPAFTNPPARDPRRRLSLRRRLLGEALLALTAISVLGLIAFGFALNRVVMLAAQENATGQALEIARSVADGSLTPAQLSEEVGSHHSVIQLVDQSGRVLRSSPDEMRSEAVSDLTPAVDETQSQEVGFLPGKDDHLWVVVARGVAAPDGRPMRVYVAEPMRTESTAVRTTTLWLGLAGLGTLAIFVVLLRRSLREALEPVRRITDEVAQISQARTDDRVTVPPTGDEIAHLGTVMNRMLDRLDLADRTKQDFLADASHELRSPLATMRAVMEGQPSRPGTEAAERDRIMLAEVHRMARVVDDISTLAKGSDASVWLEHTDVDLDDIVHREVLRLRRTVDLTVTASIEPARVTGDAGRLAQTVRNLTDNAARHATSQVAVRLSTDGPDAVLTVDNDGPAIPPEERERVFDRFVRLDPARARPEGLGGSGLGLPIARMLAQAHGGDVQAGDAPDGMCRFEVRIPRQDAQEDDEPSPLASR